MIDTRELRDVITTRIHNSGFIPTDCFAWSNIIFNPTGKGLWISEAYLPATGGYHNSVKNDYEQGIFQFTIYIDINNPKGEIVVNDIANSIANLFTTPETITTENTKTSIVLNKSFQGKIDDKWYASIIDINYKCYNK